jgi:hypothetical protein
MVAAFTGVIRLGRHSAEYVGSHHLIIRLPVWLSDGHLEIVATVDLPLQPSPKAHSVPLSE